MAETSARFCGSIPSVKFAVVLFPLINELPATEENLAPAIFERFKNPEAKTSDEAEGFLSHSIVPLSSAAPEVVALGITISPVKIPFPVE